LVRWPLTGLLYQPWTIYDERGAVVGMRIGRGNRSTRRTPTPIPHDLTWARTRAAAVVSRRLTHLSYGTDFINECYFIDDMERREQR
jgi:hypothetical protein